MGNPGKVERGPRSTRVLAAASVAAVALTFAPVVSAQSVSLFVGPEPEGAAASAVSAGAVGNFVSRERRVDVDFSVLERVRAALLAGDAPRALTVDLFDGTSYEAVAERTEATFSGGYSISARIPGEPAGRATLVVNGATVAGTVRTLGGTWRIVSSGDGRQVLREEDPGKLPPLCGVEGASQIDVRPRGGAIEPRRE